MSCGKDSRGAETPRKRVSPAREVSRLALCTALALIFSYVETFIPSPGIPGVKIGLANIAIIFVLYRFGIWRACAVSFVRLILSAVLFGSLQAFVFALSGAILSMTVMLLIRKTGMFSCAGVSIAGGVAHNMGQLVAAAFVVGSRGLVAYLPVLMVAGVVTGCVIGIVSAICIKYVRLGN